ncbi:phage tail protein [Bartonella vinsonii]|uniref:Phage Tail Collar Domain n=1 Tax=Bartonella vinsonii TaxID=33047 RepID=A0A448V817_BARVI|nr:phage tail protein [Bartonella vinsonii]VEJ45937.1 Phage Tail Collar Domain [Bartonella vinsonii]
MSSIYDWSLLALENASADEDINWAEGQPPSSVNDSARAMMQRIKEYLFDNGGGIETEFTVDEDNKRTSLRLTTKSPFESYMNGIVVRFKAQGVNQGTTNVALNKLPTRPVYKITSEGIVPLKGGEIQKGGLYELVYTCDIAGKNADGWFLTNPTNRISSSVPSGCLALFSMKTVPEGWLVCDGKAYWEKEYPDLFHAVGYLWGKGDDDGTFKVPDFRESRSASLYFDILGGENAHLNALFAKVTYAIKT